MGLGTTFVTTRDGVRIACSQHGNGPPLVFVRGWITHLELLWSDPSFRAFFEEIGTHNRVVRFDMRGNGLSDRDVPLPDVADLTTDIEAVMDGLEIETATVWGSSYGGPPAIRYAAEHPERVDRLILDGTFAVGRDTVTPEQHGVGRMIQAMPSASEAVFAGMSYLTDPEPTMRHEQRVDRAVRSVEPVFAAHLYSLLARIDVSEQARSIPAPTLVLNRRGSKAVNADAGRRLAALIPGARYVSLEGRAHNPWEGDAEAPLREIWEFLHPGESSMPAVRTVRGGLVVVLFTDLVGSTGLTAALGDAAAQDLLRFHNSVIRSALDGHGGREVKHTGDGIMGTFGSVTAALACAIEIRDGFATHNASASGPPLLVRLGLSAGEPIGEDGDMFGSSVQMAARVCSQAEAGQILVPNVVRELAAGKGFSFADSGTRELRGFPQPVQLYDVGAG
ncbi:MAG: adenylate/guanylate cyclase domain-containing protein [Acidimicrobiia bacterium]|nr:adenylate/guanylate cyclase domain-containing protein [Acidimicrobiia bacterium]